MHALKVIAQILSAVFYLVVFLFVAIGALYFVSHLTGCTSAGRVEEPPAMQYSDTREPAAREI